MLKKKEIIAIVYMITEYISSLKYTVLLSLIIVLSFGYYVRNNVQCIEKIDCDTSCTVVEGRYYDYIDYGHSIVFNNVNYAKPKNLEVWNKTMNYHYYFTIVDSCQVFVTHSKYITKLKNKCVINYEYQTSN